MRRTRNPFAWRPNRKKYEQFNAKASLTEAPPLSSLFIALEVCSSKQRKKNSIPIENNEIGNGTVSGLILRRYKSGFGCRKISKGFSFRRVKSVNWAREHFHPLKGDATPSRSNLLFSDVPVFAFRFLPFSHRRGPKFPT